MGELARPVAPAILENARHGKWWSRFYSFALVELGDVALPYLLNRIARKNSGFETELEAVRRIRPRNPRMLPHYLRALQSASEEEARVLVEGMANLGPVSVEAMTRLLGHAKAPYRALGALGLGRIGPPAQASLPALLDALKDEDSQVRVNAAWALGCIRQAPEAAPRSPKTMDAFWVAELRANPKNWSEHAVRHWLARPTFPASLTAGLAVRIREELEPNRLDEDFVCGLLQLLAMTSKARHAGLILDAMPLSEVLYAPAALGLARAGEGALGLIFDRAREDAGLKSEYDYFWEQAARYYRALAVWQVAARATPERAREIRRRMAAHPDIFMRFFAGPLPRITPKEKGRVRTKTFRAGDQQIIRTTTPLDFPVPLCIRAVERPAGSKRLYVLGEGGKLLTFLPTGTGAYRLDRFQDLNLLVLKRIQQATPMPIKWHALTSNRGGLVIAAGTNEEKRTVFCLFQDGKPEPLAVEFLPIRDLEELALGPDGRGLVALEYWHDVHWIRLRPRTRPCFEIEATRNGGFCCQVAGTLLSDGRTFVVTTHHAGLVAMRPRGPLAPVFWPGEKKQEEIRAQVARALPDDTLVCRTWDGDVRRIDPYTRRIFWKTHIELPGERIAASGDFWVALGRQNLVLGRTVDGAVLGRLPITEEKEAYPAGGDKRTHHRVLAFGPGPGEFVLAVRSQGPDMLVHFAIR
jgi:hypothetical protein